MWDRQQMSFTCEPGCDLVENGRKMKKTQEQKRQLEEARKSEELKRKRETRLGEAIVKWEEKIDEFETALEPFRHKRGKPRIREQNVMAMETALHFMRQAREDADEDLNSSCLSLTAVDASAAAVHGFKIDHLKTIRQTLVADCCFWKSINSRSHGTIPSITEDPTT